MTDLPDPIDQTTLASQQTPPALNGKKKMRASSERRVQEIIVAAAEHFSEVGFGGSTREIAKRVGVTQPLLYRYFPNKDVLIEAVYRKVYLERWDQSWDQALKDRSIPVRQRFERFYREYTYVVFTPLWLRLSYYAGLRDADINQWYNHLIEEMILKQLVREHRVELGLSDEAYVSAAELEPAWQIHGGLMHHGWRKHVLNLKVADDIEQVICDNLDMYFAIAEGVYERERRSTVSDMGHEQN